MSRNMKIVVGIVGALLLLCCGATLAVAFLLPVITERVLGDVTVVEEEAAADVGQEIAAYDLPPGFSEQGAVDLLGMRMVIIAAEDSSNMAILLAQFPDFVAQDTDEMRRQMEGTFAGQSGSAVSFTAVSTETTIINDQKVALTTYEGADENGQMMHQVTAVFANSSGDSVMMMIMGPVAEWNSDAVAQFIDSLQ